MAYIIHKLNALLFAPIPHLVRHNMSPYTPPRPNSVPPSRKLPLQSPQPSHSSSVSSTSISIIEIQNSLPHHSPASFLSESILNTFPTSTIQSAVPSPSPANPLLNDNLLKTLEIEITVLEDLLATIRGRQGFFSCTESAQKLRKDYARLTEDLASKKVRLRETRRNKEREDRDSEGCWDGCCGCSGNRSRCVRGCWIL